MTIRIGQGIDVHAFANESGSRGASKQSAGEKTPTSFTLGGVEIAHSHALLAHSDGDVLLHALCDALLGALALGDIGQHFPDTDARYANINSRELLRHVVQLVAQQGFRLSNADMSIVAQAPRMAPHIPAMRENIASDTAAALNAISVKATTSEQLGFTGRGEGIACFAVVLLESVSAS